MPESQRMVPADHPAFPGHFPGDPLVPGVVLLDWAWQACRAALPPETRLQALIAAKFLGAVRPGDTLVFRVEPGAVQSSFEIRRDDAPVAQGRFSHG